MRTEPPEFYVFPVQLVKDAQNKNDKWGKITISNIPNHGIYQNNWSLIADFLKSY
jgi:hypothetical protein